jgi:hypothetical protein
MFLFSVPLSLRFLLHLSIIANTPSQRHPITPIYTRLPLELGLAGVRPSVNGLCYKIDVVLNRVEIRHPHQATETPVDTADFLAEILIVCPKLLHVNLCLSYTDLSTRKFFSRVDAFDFFAEANAAKSVNAYRCSRIAFLFFYSSRAES